MIVNQGHSQAENDGILLLSMRRHQNADILGRPIQPSTVEEGCSLLRAAIVDYQDASSAEGRPLGFH